jgi:transcription elongation factor Elf1
VANARAGATHSKGGHANASNREASIRYQYRILEAMEHFFVCPYCGERISMVLDTSVNGQTYVEDCEVCCQPVEVRYTVKEDQVRYFEARPM